MGLFGDIAGLGLQIAGAGIDNFWQGKNYKLQKENLAYQKSVQQKTWEREDNATQRRVADLKAAGLSPTLAAGGAAQTSAPIHTDAPQRESNMQDRATSVMNAMVARKNLDATQAEIEYKKDQQELTKSQKHESDISAQLKLAQKERERALAQNNDLADFNKKNSERIAQDTDTAGKMLDQEIRRYNFQKAKDMGVREDIKGGMQAEAQQLSNVLQWAYNRVHGGPLKSALGDKVRPVDKSKSNPIQGAGREKYRGGE